MDELTKRVDVATWYGLSHITGPGAVWMRICFGVTPEGGPRVERRLRTSQSNGEVKFDLDAYLAEALAGVVEANARFGANLQIEAIQVVTDDYPTPGQAKFVAYKIVARAIEDLRKVA